MIKPIKSTQERIDDLEARLAGAEERFSKSLAVTDQCINLIDDMNKRFRQEFEVMRKIQDALVVANESLAERVNRLSSKY